MAEEDGQEGTCEMKWLEQISIVAIRHDGEAGPIPEAENWRASRFDGDRKLVTKLDEEGADVLDERTGDPIYIANPEQICSFRKSIAIDLQSHADTDLAVVMIAKVNAGRSMTMSATLRVLLPAHGTCTVALERAGDELVQHHIQLNAFEPAVKSHG